jgi:UPF0755 protein
VADARRRGKRRAGGGLFRTVFSALAELSILTLFCLCAAYGYVSWSFSTPGPISGAIPAGAAPGAALPATPRPGTIVTIERGASLARIAAGLQQAGVIRHDWLFARAAPLVGLSGQLKAGEYEIPAGASMTEIWRLLESGKARLFAITIPEGHTSAMAVAVLADSSILSGPVPPTPDEGALLPETYMVTRGESRAEVLGRMMQAQRDLMASLWPQRAADLPFDTIAQAVTLASIVEKETGVAAERPRVAAVFVNRLRQGMRLQSDPTIIYGVCKCQKLLDAQGNPRGIRRSEIDAKTPYNTYQIDGLPPTPIANPGRAALAAVLNPPKTDELFFVADGTGGHVFSRSYAEHDAAVARWRDIERQRVAQTPAPSIDPGLGVPPPSRGRP